PRCARGRAWRSSPQEERQSRLSRLSPGHFRGSSGDFRRSWLSGSTLLRMPAQGSPTNEEPPSAIPPREDGAKLGKKPPDEAASEDIVVLKDVKKSYGETEILKGISLVARRR